MKPCVNCQQNEAEYCTNCIDKSENPIRTKDKENSMLLAFCISCETIVGQKNVEKHIDHHINLRRVQI